MSAASDLSRLTFEARELVAMFTDVTESRSGQPDAWGRRVLAELDAFRASRGWSKHGFGGEESEDRRQAAPVSGWSTTVAELRAALEGAPDDYEVVLDGADVGDCEIIGVNVGTLYPPDALGSAGLLVLTGGQALTLEYGYHDRMDAHHALGGSRRWDPDAGWVGR